MMMKPFDEDDLTALKLSSMNVSNRNAEMPSNRKQRDAVNYQETNLMKYAKEAFYWSEEELNSLWIGARMHGQSAWEAMLNDSRLRFSNFRTPTSLAERWILERQKIESENIQAPWTSNREKPLAVQTIDEAEISCGFMNIHKKADSSSSRRPAAVSQPSKKRVAVIGHAKFRKRASIKTSQDQDNITGMGNIIDPSKIDFELSLNEWVKGKDSVLTIDEAEISSGLMKIHKKADSSSSSRPAAVSQPSKKRVAVIGHAKSRKLASIKTSQDQDNITGMGNSIDPSKFDFDLSLDEWVKGNDSEGSVSG